MEGALRAFLNSARSKSSQSQKEVEQNSQYQQLEKAYKDAYRDRPGPAGTNCKNRSPI